MQKWPGSWILWRNLMFRCLENALRDFYAFWNMPQTFCRWQIFALTRNRSGSDLVCFCPHTHKKNPECHVSKFHIHKNRQPGLSCRKYVTGLKRGVCSLSSHSCELEPQFWLHSCVHSTLPTIIFIFATIPRVPEPVRTVDPVTSATVSTTEKRDFDLLWSGDSCLHHDQTCCWAGLASYAVYTRAAGAWR